MKLQNKLISAALAAVLTFGAMAAPNITPTATFAFAANSSKLSAPKDFKAKIKTSTTITLSWSKVSGASAYRVYKYNPDKNKFVKVKDVTGVSLTIKNLKPATTYKFKICTLKKKSGKYVKQELSSAISVKTLNKALGSSSVLEDYKSKYFYSMLSSKQKTAYRRMYEAAENFEEQPDLSDLGLDYGEEADVAFALKFENPQFFYIGNLSQLAYVMTKKDALKIKPKLEAAAKKISQKAMKESDIKERIRIIHDEICNMTTYQLSYDEAYGPLLYGEALCEGYGKAFAYVAQMSGIQTVCVTGFAARGAHLWNMVNLGDEWVHVDVTFDDQSSISYEYFCIDDDYAGLDHVPESYLPFPTSLAEAYDEEEIVEEFNKFMAQVKENYDKGIMTTRFYSDYKPFGGLLQYAVYHMNQGVQELGIDKQPWYMYWTNWIEIELR